jgi:ArsR family transcriptional regulator
LPPPSVAGIIEARIRGGDSADLLVVRGVMKMAKKRTLSDEALEMVAARFRCLGEPMRLKILRALQDGSEKSVTQLVAELGATQANVSKHLKTLVEAGILARRPQGTTVYYRIAAPEIFELCEVVCNTLAAQLSTQAERLGLRVLQRRRT